MHSLAARSTLHLTEARRRGLFALAAVTLLAGAVAVVASRGTGLWQLIAFAIGPDLALLAGAGRGLAKGAIHPRAVGLYNALHRLWGPAALLAVALAGLLPAGFLAGALAWGFHVTLDRSVGYGLRARDGSQRR